MSKRKLIASYFLVFVLTWIVHQKAASYVGAKLYGRFLGCAMFGGTQEECAKDAEPRGMEKLVVF